MDFEHIGRLNEFGFVGGIRIADLQVSCRNLPQERGVYLVTRKNKHPATFVKSSTGGHFKKRDPSVPDPVLKERWLARPRVIYIGKAGGNAKRSTIQDRLNWFMQFGLGRRCAHWGGRYIWQLADAKDLVVYWKTTPRADPRQVEKALLREFIQKYGRLPFANLRR